MCKLFSLALLYLLKKLILFLILLILFMYPLREQILTHPHLWQLFNQLRYRHLLHRILHRLLLYLLWWQQMITCLVLLVHEFFNHVLLQHLLSQLFRLKLRRAVLAAPSQYRGPTAFLRLFLTGLLTCTTTTEAWSRRRLHTETLSLMGIVDLVWARTRADLDIVELWT